MTNHSAPNNATDDVWKDSPFGSRSADSETTEKNRSPVEEKVAKLADRVEELNERVDESTREQSNEKIWGDSPFQ